MWTEGLHYFTAERCTRCLDRTQDLNTEYKTQTHTIEYKHTECRERQNRKYYKRIQELWIFCQYSNYRVHVHWMSCEGLGLSEIQNPNTLDVLWDKKLYLTTKYTHPKCLGRRNTKSYQWTQGRAARCWRAVVPWRRGPHELRSSPNPMFQFPAHSTIQFLLSDGLFACCSFHSLSFPSTLSHYFVVCCLCFLLYTSSGC